MGLWGFAVGGVSVRVWDFEGTSQVEASEALDHEEVKPLLERLKD